MYIINFNNDLYEGNHRILGYVENEWDAVAMVGIIAEARVNALRKRNSEKLYTIAPGSSTTELFILSIEKNTRFCNFEEKVWYSWTPNAKLDPITFQMTDIEDISCIE